ncbi:MAG TPA: membrane protein insertase YidC [Candidatus Sulfotelmatobacter sp.]|nr:membrane protein insertase YidC [Candidatus Sulfotelmatobacter sp.]
MTERKAEMSDQVRAVIFVVVVMVITFVWLRIYKPPAQPALGPELHQTAPSAGAAQPTAAQAAIAPPMAPVNVPVVQAAAEKIVTVESPLYHIEITNRGAVVRSWTLTEKDPRLHDYKYVDDQKPPHPLDLVNSAAAQELGWPFSLALSDAQLEASANSGLYEVTTNPAANSSIFDAPATITLHWSDGHLDVTKKLSFTPNYEMSGEVLASLDGKPLTCGISWRGGFGDKSVYKAPQLASVFYDLGGSLTVLQYKKLGAPGNQIQPYQQPGGMQFAGAEDQFFAAAFIPNGTDLYLSHWTQWHHYTANNQPAFDPVAEMAVGSAAPGPVKFRAFIGPKDLALLGKVQPSLEGLVQFGWTGVIAKPMLFVLQWLHRYIPNYGWAIVVFTLALTMILLPIRVWTFHSMRRMQVVAPEMKMIQDRYRKYSMTDPRRQKMNDEIMALYAKHGLSPWSQISGCLPTLLQIPFLWAFYRMLAGAIELRHAPWIFWIHDLSARDPYFILPIAMAATMYFSTKMMPTPATVDPSQQRMMALMPLMMGVFFFSLSSGLNLYYFTSNLVSVGQQLYLNRTQPAPTRSKFKNKKQ